MTTATHEDSTGASQPVHTSSNPAVGTYDEAVAHVGRRSPTYVADVPVGEGSVAMFCAMIEDANPIYWDRELAQQIFGGPVAPPALVQGTVLPLPWRPDGARSQNLAVFQVPLPGRTPEARLQELSRASPYSTVAGPCRDAPQYGVMYQHCSTRTCRRLDQ